MKKLQLHQFLSKTGAFPTKRDALNAIYAGEISIDGKAVRVPHFQFRPTAKSVTWKGRALHMQPDHIYILLNKPIGYLSAKGTGKDAGRPSVFDLIDIPLEQHNALVCVGRLDEQTSGLLLMTTDGDFSYRITHPQHSIWKTYLAALDKPIPSQDCKRLEQGMSISAEGETYHTLPALTLANGDRLLLSIQEGKKRQVRLMLAALGYRVHSLSRIAIGNITAEDIPPGKFRRASGDKLLQDAQEVPYLPKLSRYLDQ